MWIQYQLAFRSYLPKNIEKGQMFLASQEKGKFAYPEIVVYDGKMNSEEWVNVNGWPVELYIVDPGDPHEDVEYVIATPEQIGWIDEGSHVDTLCDLELKHINTILRDYDSWVGVECEEVENEDYPYKPLLHNGKIVIRYADDYLYDWGGDDNYEEEDIPLEEEDNDDRD